MKPYILGIIAGTLCTVSFIPQVAAVLKTKRTKDLSLVTFSVFSLGVFLWLLYGIAIKDIVIIMANGITLFLSAIILTAKIKYG